MNTIKELRAAAGMTQKAFAEYFGISKRAIESWEGGQRECPLYLLELMKYKLEKEYNVELVSNYRVYWRFEDQSDDEYIQALSAQQAVDFVRKYVVGEEAEIVDVAKIVSDWN